MIFADSSLTLRQCGALCRVSSDEIFDSGISVGLECLDRELFDFDRAAFEEAVHQLNPRAPIFPIAATKGDGVEAWAEWLAERIRAIQ